MIKVKLIKKNNYYIGYNSSGHSGYDEIGRDIVCAGVSSILYAIANTLKEKKYDFKLDIKDENFSLVLDSNYKDVQDLFLVIKNGILGIYNEYPEYVQLYIEEVEND